MTTSGWQNHDTDGGSPEVMEAASRRPWARVTVENACLHRMTKIFLEAKRREPSHHLLACVRLRGVSVSRRAQCAVADRISTILDLVKRHIESLLVQPMVEPVSNKRLSLTQDTIIWTRRAFATEPREPYCKGPHQSRD